MTEHLRPLDVAGLENAIFTLGHSTLPIERFLALTRTYAIKCIADIRSLRRSRHNPQFNESDLAAALAEAQLEYSPLPGLGGLRRPHKDSQNDGWRNDGFRGYADYMQTPAFQDSLEVLIRMSKNRRVAIMCAEAVPWRCHRSLVADALIVRGVAAVEVLSANTCRMHSLTPFAQVQGIQITYPPEQRALF